MKRMSRLEEYNKTVKEIEDDRKYNPPPGSREWGLYELEKIKVSMITDIAKSLAVIADNSERKRIFKRRKDERQIYALSANITARQAQGYRMGRCRTLYAIMGR